MKQLDRWMIEEITGKNCMRDGAESNMIYAQSKYRQFVKGLCGAKMKKCTVWITREGDVR